MAYRERVIDALLDSYLEEVGAVLLDGPKGVGKTVTAKKRAATTYELDDPVVHQVVEADPSLALSQPAPVLFDEWQRLPSMWDAVKREVSKEDSTNGPFILTGSAYAPDATTHSGAGRFLEIRMRPMTLSERGVCSPVFSIGALMNGQQEIPLTASSLKLKDYVNELTASGFPGIRKLSLNARQAMLDSYITTIINKDMKEAGHNVRKPERLRAWLKSYAAATSTTTSWEKIRTAATPGQTQTIAKGTTIPYIETLEMLRIIDSVPGWLPTNNHLLKVTQAPKHHLADPALAAVLLGQTSDSLLRGASDANRNFDDPTLLGALFESLVVLNVRVFAQANHFDVSHMRTELGRHEVDIILQSKNGDVTALEGKLSPIVGDKDVAHLLWLKNKLGEKLKEMVVVTTGSTAYRRSDGVAVIPLALLGA
jgi:predicted AAA+ superfamily ATPase